VAKVAKPLGKEYATDEIVVEGEPRLCFHSGNCSRLLPKVFDRDRRRRPWVKADEASADEIELTVNQCPSGALRTRRAKGASVIPPQRREIRASKGGPLLVRAGISITDGDGNLLYEGDRAALCRCGGSSNRPFCDGTHKTNGFEG
jgi:uncharacterized Fe-S cluster protein YjdI/CDGSH-type Zn-finger protein